MSGGNILSVFLYASNAWKVASIIIEKLSSSHVCVISSGDSVPEIMSNEELDPKLILVGKLMSRQK